MIIIRAENIDMKITLAEDVVIAPAVYMSGVYFIFRPDGKEVRINLHAKTTSAELFDYERRFLLKTKLISTKNELVFKKLTYP